MGQSILRMMPKAMPQRCEDKLVASKTLPTYILLLRNDIWGGELTRNGGREMQIVDSEQEINVVKWRELCQCTAAE